MFDFLLHNSFRSHALNQLANTVSSGLSISSISHYFFSTLVPQIINRNPPLPLTYYYSLFHLPCRLMSPSLFLLLISTIVLYFSPPCFSYAAYCGTCVPLFPTRILRFAYLCSSPAFSIWVEPANSPRHITCSWSLVPSCIVHLQVLNGFMFICFKGGAWTGPKSSCKGLALFS
ncbi:hypothetical protein BKA82DRAFT_4109321 [Pisolithus tinctorius]|nr:hypothetical protein BKA82DRAFT_4109321 [Pisolithus tinctorius]